ncbi:sodium-coupled monocarboxylate transporter 2 [Grus japonensis]|uniref:Sodium-coupled monocarboxylate transporter 2 n=1 Tax=Grus japonensis TaxID=30415 RepID=A0ABC9WX58_GRUJA
MAKPGAGGGRHLILEAFSETQGLAAPARHQNGASMRHRSGITSTYEYLELRFNKIVRLAATLIYILQTILYTGIVVYAPSLALNQVTGFDLWGSVVATGIVCTFYCTLGGLKAVVWTDAFQMIVMVAGFVTVLIRGTTLNGGPTKVWEDAYEGSRLNIFDFDVDPLRRHTFWTIVIGGTFTWLGIYGVNQSTIQRCISCKSEKHSKLALYLNLLGLWTVLVCAVFCGLVMYSHYKSCDPWTADFISAPDQLMPYFVMDIFSSMPGVPGLFVACAFSGTLSTVAASINALATVTFEDLVKKGFPNISEKMSTWISKGLCRPLLADTWYSLSYLYFSAIGCLGCAIIGLLISFITGANKGEDIPPVLIKPVCNLFCFWSERLKAFLWCGVRHDSQEVDFERNLPKVIANKNGTDDTFKNNINKENKRQFPGYNPEENSYTNVSRESRL